MSSEDPAPPARLLYRTPQGSAYVGDSLSGVRDHLEDESVQLFMTSPPFALRRKKEYGNKSADEYIAWFKTFAEVFWDKLKPDGSLVIDLGGSWNPGHPTRSLYQFELLIELCKHMRDNKNFHLAQEFYWYNPAKMPSPAQWVTVDRVRVKDAVNTIWWLSKTENPKASNRRVLKPYSRAMKNLLKRGTYNTGPRRSQQSVSKTAWATEHQGAIPANQFSYQFDPLQDSDNVDAALAEATEDSVNWLENRQHGLGDSLSPGAPAAGKGHGQGGSACAAGTHQGAPREIPHRLAGVLHRLPHRRPNRSCRRSVRWVKRDRRGSRKG